MKDIMIEKYTLAEIEKEMAIYEDPQLENPVELAWHNACSILEILPNTAHYLLGKQLTKQDWFKERVNPYHNGIHTAQVMHAGAILWNIEKQTNNILLDKNVGDRLAPYFLIALMYHDFKHPGRANKHPFEIEQKSFDALSKFLLFDDEFYEVWEDKIEFELDEGLKQICTIIVNLILSTEVQIATKECIEKYLKEKESEQMEVFTAFSLLMSEADLLTSILPNIGKENGKKLALELNTPVIATDLGRAGFLKTVKYVSFAAQSLEIQKTIDEEITELLK